MNLIPCFQTNSFENIQLGTTFARFEQLWSPTQQIIKHTLSAEEGSFACFVKGAECIFVEDCLTSVEISDISLFFDEPKKNIKNVTLSKTIEILAFHNLSWQIYSKYTKGQEIVIIMNNLLYEFKFIAKQFRLNVIRLEQVN
jgi:hypothetical protein